MTAPGHHTGAADYERELQRIAGSTAAAARRRVAAAVARFDARQRGFRASTGTGLAQRHKPRKAESSGLLDFTGDSGVSGEGFHVPRPTEGEPR